MGYKKLSETIPSNVYFENKCNKHNGKLHLTAQSAFLLAANLSILKADY